MSLIETIDSYIDYFRIYEPESFIITNKYLIHIVGLGTVLVYFLMVKFLPGLLMTKGKEWFGKDFNGFPSENKDKKLTPLGWIMFFYNLGMSLASLVGLILGLGSLMWAFRNYGWVGGICDPDHYVAMVGFQACRLFVVLKYVELLDTLFLILKKPERPVMFLHYYHHITVLLFAFYSNLIEGPICFIFGVINFTIHFFMYYYYAMALIGRRPTWGKMLTLGQIFQMFAAIVILGSFLYYHFTLPDGCHFSSDIFPYEKSTLTVCFCTYCAIMYGSYLWLFVKFFAKKYFGKSKKKGGKEKGRKEEGDSKRDDKEK